MICVRDSRAGKFFAFFLAASPMYVARFRFPLPITLRPTLCFGRVAIVDASKSMLSSPLSYGGSGGLRTKAILASFLGVDKEELVGGGLPRGEFLFTLCLRENRVGVVVGVEIGVGSIEVRGDNDGRSDRDSDDEGRSWD